MSYKNIVRTSFGKRMYEDRFPRYAGISFGKIMDEDKLPRYVIQVSDHAGGRVDCIANERSLGNFSEKDIGRIANEAKDLITYFGCDGYVLDNGRVTQFTGLDPLLGPSSSRKFEVNEFPEEIVRKFEQYLKPRDVDL